MYTECIKCPKLGVSCDGPNFVAMSSTELIKWCKQRKSYLGISNQKLAEMSNIPVGTINRLFAESNLDFKHETIRPMVQALVGGKWKGKPCPNPDEHIEEKLHIAEDENARLKDIVTKNESDHRKGIESQQVAYIESIKLLRQQLRDKNIAIVVLSIFFVASLALIFGYLVYDFLHPEWGMFWLN